MREDPHPSPIRSVPPLSNIYAHRSEGLATGVEEMFIHLGLLEENSPRARELVWIMLAQRAARATSGLMLHGNEWDMEEAGDFASRWTPRGWLPDGALVRGEQHLYLRQPGYGTSYLVSRPRDSVSTEGADAPLWQGETTRNSSAISRRRDAARVAGTAHQRCVVAAHECHRISGTGH